MLLTPPLWRIKEELGRIMVMTLMTKTTLTTFLTIPMTPQLLPYTQHGDGADTMDMIEENKRFVMNYIVPTTITILIRRCSNLMTSN